MFWLMCCNLDFYATAERSGTFEFEWVDDAGVRGRESAKIEVT